MKDILNMAMVMKTFCAIRSDVGGRAQRSTKAQHDRFFRHLIDDDIDWFAMANVTVAMFDYGHVHGLQLPGHRYSNIFQRYHADALESGDTFRSAWTGIEIVSLKVTCMDWEYAEIESLLVEGKRKLKECMPWLSTTFRFSTKKSIKTLEAILAQMRERHPADYRKMTFPRAVGMVDSISALNVELRQICASCGMANLGLACCAGVS